MLGFAAPRNDLFAALRLQQGLATKDLDHSATVQLLEKLNPLSNIRGAQARPTVFHSWTVAAAQITAPRHRQYQEILSTKLQLRLCTSEWALAQRRF